MKAVLSTLAMVLATAAVPLAAQTDTERALELREAQQREWIGQSRLQTNAQFRLREIGCYQRFAVNDCLNQSRRAEREIMADLRRQEVLINDARRKRRAAEQLLRADERLHGAGRP